MPKLKTHRGAAKRFKVTAKGRVKRSKAYHSHNLGVNKTHRQKKRLAKGDLIHSADEQNIRRLLPYS